MSRKVWGRCWRCLRKFWGYEGYCPECRGDITALPSEGEQ